MGWLLLTKNLRLLKRFITGSIQIACNEEEMDFPSAVTYEDPFQFMYLCLLRSYYLCFYIRAFFAL